MSRPDDFSTTTKRQLAERAGHRCCFPSCGVPTVGPSEESDISIGRTGMACHISAASPGPSAKRYVAAMSSEERQSYANGIWMCYTHGKLIDTDEVRFPIEILTQWREVGERIASIMRDNNLNYQDALRLARVDGIYSKSFALSQLGGAENELIGHAIEDSGVADLWGKELANATRSFFIEHARNAFQHGSATKVSFETSLNRLTLVDDGKLFNPKTLATLEGKSGGIVSTQGLLALNQRIVLLHERRGDVNVTTLVRVVVTNDLSEATACCYTLNLRDFHEGKLKITFSETCKEIFIVLPKFVSFSDFRGISEVLPLLKDDPRAITFVGQDLSELERKCLQELYPNCGII